MRQGLAQLVHFYHAISGLNLGGKAHDKHIKINIGLKNLIPASVRFCDKQADSSENVTLVQVIKM
ncbi:MULTISPECIES: hypothetical protein [unclassified Candidatus Tisiphia]|uniref:hypothetical protein n=1 Tax=unclassified Candidatus Tisiphia TaxID=2996318 RepID=UPI00312CA1C8